MIRSFFLLPVLGIYYFKKNLNFTPKNFYVTEKVAFYTLGCKLNFAETSAIGRQFKDQGFKITDFENPADVYVINTCTVTENAEKDCRKIVRRALRNNPGAFVIVTGCYAQLRPEEISAIKGVDAVLGSAEKFRVFDILNSFEKKELSCIFVSPDGELNESFGPAFSSDADSRTRAFLKIQDGCDYKCSFCTIPKARGGSRSQNPDEVLSNFNQLIAQGYKEIVLTGVNTGDYLWNSSINFYQLLTMLVKQEGDFRIRISSIEPNLLTDEIIQLTAENEKMCNHFHIPLQNGSPEILRLMQRRYTAADYENLISRIMEKIPDCGIGVDVITGFPGETEAHFKETHDFLRNLPISYLHVFTYSERPDTKAASMEGQIAVETRRMRTNILRNLSDKKRAVFYTSMTGEQAEVIFEHENDNGLMKGFTSNYIRVEHLYREELVNKKTAVLLESFNGITFKGSITGYLATA